MASGPFVCLFVPTHPFGGAGGSFGKRSGRSASRWSLFGKLQTSVVPMASIWLADVNGTLVVSA